MKLHIVRTILIGSMMGILGVSGGCSWVKPKVGAELISLASSAQVDSCQLKGRTTSQVKDKLGILTRRTNTVSEELIALAKNAALTLGGDTIVAVSEREGGSQEFEVFLCQ